jgi:predicted transcriptional regulator
LKKSDESEALARRIVDVFLSSETMADIVLLFRSNPRLIDSEDHIASRIGQNCDSVSRDLKKLAELGILHTEKIGKRTWFGFDGERDKRIQEIVKNYIRSV